MQQTTFLDKFDDYYTFQCGIIDELIKKHVASELYSRKEKHRIFNKKSIRVFLNNVSEYFNEMYTEDQLMEWILYKFGENAKKLVHYRLLLRFKKVDGPVKKVTKVPNFDLQPILRSFLERQLDVQCTTGSTRRFCWIRVNGWPPKLHYEFFMDGSRTIGVELHVENPVCENESIVNVVKTFANDDLVWEQWKYGWRLSMKLPADVSNNETAVDKMVELIKTTHQWITETLKI